MPGRFLWRSIQKSVCAIDYALILNCGFSEEGLAMTDDTRDEKSCCNKGGHCPAFLTDLPMDRKVLVVLGGLVIVLTFLNSTVWNGFGWILAALGAAMVYGGYTGHCLMTLLLTKMCCHKKSGDGSSSCCGDKADAASSEADENKAE